MAIFTRNLAFVAGSISIAALLSACDHSADYTKIVRLRGIKGEFLVSNIGTPALSADYKQVEYRSGSKAEMLFRGSGGSDPVLLIDIAKRLLIIAACGNNEVFETTSAFAEDPKELLSTTYRVQLVNNPGFFYAGKPLCVPKPSEVISIDEQTQIARPK